MVVDDFTVRSLAEIAQTAYRDEAGSPVPLDETSAALSLLTYDALGRLVTFLRDLSMRPPLAGPAWQAHRDILEALVADIEKHRLPLYYDELHR